MGTEFTPNARLVLEHRYLRRNRAGQVCETPEGMFRRVARAVAEVDRHYDGPAQASVLEESYFQAMSELLFLPNSPTLMNAGTSMGQLAACFVLPVGDSIRQIFAAVREMAIIHQTGGGTGFSFSHLRPKGEAVRETGGVASGPVSFMRVFDTATEVVKQGGRRRGANMGLLRADHPDILEFVSAKDDPTMLTNFNLSVSVPDAFFRALQGNGTWPLINPRGGRVRGRIQASELWEAICQAAWRTGDPGLLFIDQINRHNPTPASGIIEATNPCGETPLLAYEACNLGSINLSRLVRPEGFDWQRLDELVRLAVRFLDNVVEVSRYPLPRVSRMVRANRKIGLGVMGLAEALIQLGIPYASFEAARLAGSIMLRLSSIGRQESANLAARRGPFPNYRASIWPSRGVPPLRNATVTTVAPTGTLSIIAGTSSGIEPLFALAYVRTVLDGANLVEVNPFFVEALERLRLPADRIVNEVGTTGSVQAVEAVSARIRDLFQTALNVSPEWHVRLQAAVQRHTDNAVSKTVNLPATAGSEAVRAVYELAWRLGCKGVTVYRYGARGEQVLHLERVPAFALAAGLARAHAEFSGECRLCSV